MGITASFPEVAGQGGAPVIAAPDNPPAPGAPDIPQVAGQGGDGAPPAAPPRAFPEAVPSVQGRGVLVNQSRQAQRQARVHNVLRHINAVPAAGPPAAGPNAALAAYAPEDPAADDFSLGNHILPLPNIPRLTIAECELHAREFYSENGAGHSAMTRAEPHIFCIGSILKSRYRQGATLYGPLSQDLTYHAIYQYQTSMFTSWNGDMNYDIASQTTLRYYRYVANINLGEVRTDRRFFKRNIGRTRVKTWKKGMAAFLIYKLAKGMHDLGSGTMRLSQYLEEDPALYFCYIVPTAMTMITLMDNEVSVNLTLQEIVGVDIYAFVKHNRDNVGKHGLWSPAQLMVLKQNPRTKNVNTAGVHVVVAQLMDMLSSIEILSTAPVNKRLLTQSENEQLFHDFDQIVGHRGRP